MAANDYYSTSYPARPYHDNPLPPIPNSYSPFHDDNHPYSHKAPSQSFSHSFSGTSGRLGDDPFEDDHSIPLHDARKHSSAATGSNMLPHEMDDPYVRDADPRKLGKRTARERFFGGKVTWVVYVLTTIQIAVFLAEIIKNGILTKSPIEIHPSFNPMIGPSPYVLINMGARYVPCMHNMRNIQDANTTISWPCANTTSITDGSVCTLSELCGFNGVPNPHPGGSIHEKPAPNQWWRFIIPIFIHAGIIHIGFNLLLQLTLGRDVEKLIGSIRFAIVYFAAGIFGFVLGGNFAATGIASCGCSGSLFGILAITLIDLFYTWKQRTGPVKDLMFILVDVIIAFVLGLLPGLDNFSHIGGFFMGLILGVCLLRSPTAISQRRNGPETPYRNDSRNPDTGIQEFVRQPGQFFQDRRGAWWAWWVVRVIALIAALIAFILLIKNFYVWEAECSWCKYLSCLDVTVSGENWCAVGNLNFTTTTTTKPSKRALFDLAYQGFKSMEHIS